MTAIGRATTRESVGAVPDAWVELTTPYRALAAALEFRDGRSTGDPVVDQVLDAFPILISIIDVECSEYLKALTDKITNLEERIRELEEGL